MKSFENISKVQFTCTHVTRSLGDRPRVRYLTLTNHRNVCIKHITQSLPSIKVTWSDFIVFQMKAVQALAKLNMKQTCN